MTYTFILCIDRIISIENIDYMYGQITFCIYYISVMVTLIQNILHTH